MSGDLKAWILVWVCIAGQLLCVLLHLPTLADILFGAVLALYVAKAIGAYDTRERTKAAEKPA